MTARLRWASDHAILVELGDDASEATAASVHAAFVALRDVGLTGVRDLHPAQASILVEANPLHPDLDGLAASILRTVSGAEPTRSTSPRRVEIPVSYEPDDAPDLDDVAAIHGLGREDVIRLHAEATYTVHFLGFTAGFPYLGGLPPAICTPRLDRPRRRVPAGSVAIGGAQAGIYPFATPGGWRIIGRTPRILFDPRRDPPNLLGIGDRVRFVRI